MANIDAKMENWKNKLLDLGRRNKLLNYKETARSTLKITVPACQALFHMFVTEEQDLVFPHSPDEDALTLTMPDGDDFDKDANVRTNKSVSDLQKVLRNLRNKSKVAMEEQGINVLYLCFGFLNWTEVGYSDVVYSSPLVLVPATLSVESITAPYILKLHESEIVVNPTLSYKLSNDFGIQLPSYEDFESLEDFFEAVWEKVKGNGWSVSTDVGLSLLSFLKINMYDDLNRHRDAVVSNPVVRAIAGDTSALPRISEGLLNYDFDQNEEPQDVFQIVDADASQQEAILLAKKGISFVLQGPPGTGKSQTITNIIAESLADGKKVLFVSEKMAALDVVHRRLSAAGLADFCLVLHSYKTGKRHILDQLGDTLALSQKKAILSDDAYLELNKLREDRQQLNYYADQIFQTIMPLGKNIYEVNGIIASLSDYEDVIFDIKDIKNVTENQYYRFLSELSRLAATMEKMGGSDESNPWKNTLLSFVTNEFRHDTHARIESFLPSLSEIDQQVKEQFAFLTTDSPRSIDGIVKTARQLSSLENSCRVPEQWILGSQGVPLLQQVNEWESTQLCCAALSKEVTDALEFLISETFVEDIQPEELLYTDNAAAKLEEIEALLSYSDPFFRWEDSDFGTVARLFASAKEKAEEIAQLRACILEQYEKEILAIDYAGMLVRIKTEYGSVFKIFKKTYKNDKKTLLQYSKQVGRSVTVADMLSIIEQLRQLEELKSWYPEHEKQLIQFFGTAISNESSDYTAFEKYLAAYAHLIKSKELCQKLLVCCKDFAVLEPEMQTQLDFLYQEISTDWTAVRAAVQWAEQFKAAVEISQPDVAFIKKVCASPEYAQHAYACKEGLTEAANQVEEKLSWFFELFMDPGAFEKMTFTELGKKLTACMNGMSQLEDWIDFRAARECCNDDGLGACVHAMEEKNIASTALVPVFKKRFFRLWLDAVLPQYQAVLNFRSVRHNEIIREFSSLDVNQFDIAKARIKKRLIDDLPSLDHFTNSGDELSTLKRELAKQRRIMPIRKLFKAIPNLLMKLKPCLMMSPLSVSLFLEADAYQFDLIIFDEASQVCTENAIGAIARGKQAIIAGDSKQLPPTNFFQATVSESDYDGVDDEDSEDDIGIYDSVLEEANMLPERTLCWHYRSRHESLIAFSNAKIYKNHLITFPSNIENGKNNGVEFVYVQDGVYDRGGKRGNIREAQKVAQLVLDHYQHCPHRTLGVIAFGESQQIAIENAVREMRLSHREYDAFFAEDREAPFFVKSLENVQGDERDTIIFSIGYARDTSGVFRMQFGPLGKSGGERRLNVAITRAKFNVKLVSSIRPEDIRIDNISTEGPKLLRSYIEFADKGPAILAQETTESDTIQHDSPFEAAVFNFLEREGYQVRTQVGCSGYRIDMAVKHPTCEGAFVLGIECDGASYHSGRTARERDRLRQDVLENMGWNIYRIWSTDWIKDPVAEGNKLLAAVEKAIEEYGVEEQEAKTPRPDTKPENYVVVQAKKSDNANNPYGFDPYIDMSYPVMKEQKQGPYNLGECIKKVVDAEYPIHYDLLCQKLAGLYGNQKVTVRVQTEINAGLRSMERLIVRKGDFLFPRGCDTIPVRTPNVRKIQHISTEELASAMLTILKVYIGPTQKALCDETAKAYGFSRSSVQITEAMMRAIAYLISHKKVKESGEKLVLL